MLAAGFSKYVIDDYLGNELTMGAPE